MTRSRWAVNIRRDRWDALWVGVAPVVSDHWGASRVGVVRWEGGTGRVACVIVKVSRALYPLGLERVVELGPRARLGDDRVVGWWAQAGGFGERGW
jgi:hypothetical protein